MRERIRRGITSVVLLIAALVGIGTLRPWLVSRFSELRATKDVFALPAPEQTLVMSLGYRAALADLIFAHVLVDYGLHFQEKRLFEFVGNYLDTINELDPKFRDPYRFADTLLVLQPKPVPKANYYKAREILRRGMREFPYDTALWSSAGQFFAYLAPSALSDPEEQKAWQLEGGRTLARACELPSDNQRIPYQCITAAGILTRGGQRAAARQFLERVLTVNDDPEIRKLALAYLGNMISADERERAKQRDERFHRAWGADLPFVTRAAELSIGPGWDSAACAGLGHDDTEACATSFRDWARFGPEDPRP